MGEVREELGRRRQGPDSPSFASWWGENSNVPRAWWGLTVLCALNACTGWEG